MITVAPSLDAKEVSIPKIDQHQVCDPQTSHVFKSKSQIYQSPTTSFSTPTASRTSSNSLITHASSSDPLPKPSPTSRRTSFHARSSQDCPTSESVRATLSWPSSRTLSSSSSPSSQPSWSATSSPSQRSRRWAPRT